MNHLRYSPRIILKAILFMKESRSFSGALMGLGLAFSLVSSLFSHSYRILDAYILTYSIIFYLEQPFMIGLCNSCRKAIRL